MPLTAGVAEQYPAGTSTDGPGERDELPPPRGDAAKALREGSRQGLGDLRARPRAGEEHGPVTAQAAEIQLVQGHGTRRRELLTLERPEVVAGRLRGIERRQPGAHRVEGAHGGPVDILVMA